MERLFLGVLNVFSFFIVSFFFFCIFRGYLLCCFCKRLGFKFVVVLVDVRYRLFIFYEVIIFVGLRCC